MGKVGYVYYPADGGGGEMRVGFTGTRKGMSSAQKKALTMFLLVHQVREFHHGDCVGADKEAHEICRRICPGSRIVVHPPHSDKLRAFCRGDIVCAPRGYLSRNRAIVKASDIVIGSPDVDKDQTNGGTWYTIHYAEDNGVECLRLKR